MTSILLISFIAATIFGIASIPLVIMTMAYHVSLRNYVVGNCQDKLTGININEVISPFHRYENQLNHIEDNKLKKLLNTAKRTKKYFIACFVIAAIFIVIGTSVGLLASAFK